MVSVVLVEECPTFIVVCFEYVPYFPAKLEGKIS